MGLIYLRHPDHGDKIATMEAEAKHDEEYGWMRYNPGDPAPAPEPDMAFAEPAVNGLARRVRRRVEKGA